MRHVIKNPRALITAAVTLILGVISLCVFMLQDQERRFLMAGMILLARGWKRQVWEHGSGTPSIQTIFCNIGMTAAVVVCFVETALQFL